MATPGRESRAVELVYDGFISYSHAADGLLAPRLQAGLQRFAKPWWRRRALRIFRDESSLSANPHLWSSITDALDTSGWFVVLLSPDAAQSEWVNQEISYWVEHKDPDRIIPVLTDGDFGWDGDVTGSAVPDALLGALLEEPRWVDLRFAKDEDQLDLQDPRFADAVADIASAMRGVAKDELASEEVRQHRRTVRTAWAAGVMMLVLAVVAAWAGVLSARNAVEAEFQAGEARAAADEADQQRQVAEENAAEAERQAGIASSNADEAVEAGELARARELAASAQAVMADDPELAMSLALAGVLHGGDDLDPSLVIALRQALAENPIVGRLDGGSPATVLSPNGEAAISTYPDEGVISALGLDGSEVWTLDLAADLSSIDAPRMIASGAGFIVAEVVDRADPSSADVPVDETGSDGKPSRLLVIDPDSGDVVVTLELGECSRFNSTLGAFAFSPDELLLAVPNGNAACASDPDANWIDVYDTSTWEKVDLLEFGDFENVRFSSDRSWMLSWEAGGPLEIRSYPGLELSGTVSQLETRHAELSPADDRVVMFGEGTDDLDLRPRLLDIDGTFLGHLNEVDNFLLGFRPLSFSPDGRLIGVTTRTRAMVFRSSDGRLETDLGSIQSTQISFEPDGLGGVLGDFGAVHTFSLGAERPTVRPDGLFGAWVNPNQAVGGAVGVTSLVWAGERDVGMHTAILEPDSMNTALAIDGVAEPLGDGRAVAILNSIGLDYPEATVGPVVVVGENGEVDTVLVNCSYRWLEAGALTDAPCDGLVPWFDQNERTIVSVPGGGFLLQGGTGGWSDQRTLQYWSSDSLELNAEFQLPAEEWATVAGDGWFVTFNQATVRSRVRSLSDGSVVAELEVDEPAPVIVEWDRATSRLYQAGSLEEVTIVDTNQWEVIGSFTAHEGNLRGLAVDVAGHRLVTTGEDGFVKIWDVSELVKGTPQLLDRIPTPVASDVSFSGDSLIVYLRDGARLMSVPLDPGAVVSEARSRLLGGFSELECNTYFRNEHCPTFEELRSG